MLQGKDSVFEIDEMARLIDAAGAVTGYELAQTRTPIWLCACLAEHARTMTFLISDGVFPSNEDRGLCPAAHHATRDSVRLPARGRGSRHTPLVDAVVEIMGDDYPQLGHTHELIRSVVEREEKPVPSHPGHGLDDPR